MEKEARAAQRAAERAQRAQERAQEREREKEARAAQRAAERAQRAQERAQEREREKEARAAQRAAERAAKPPRKRTKKATRKSKPKGDPVTRAFGTDPNRVYEFRFRVVSLDSLITSNTDSGAVNPDYDPTLQPRQRDRSASQRQIDQVAKNLVAESLLWDFHQLDKGAPIVGADLMVESGNGRAIALRRAAAQHPERWQKYQTKLRDQLESAGLAESDLAGINNPVLVRERISEVDRAAFAMEANAPPVLQMSTLETAMVDSRRITDDMTRRLVVKEDQTVDHALRASANREFVRSFLGSLSENESALLLRKNGTLAQAGIRRVKAALFARTFPGAAGERIAETFLESLDSNIKNFETGIGGSLPALVRAESMISAGERNADSIVEDFSIALDMLARLRESEVMTVDQYVDQSSFVERETNDFQDRLLVYLDNIGRSPKKIREFLHAYAAEVEAAPHPDQVDMFGETLRLTKEQIFSRIAAPQAQRKAA
jgi:hypothetical protein